MNAARQTLAHVASAAASIGWRLASIPSGYVVIALVWAIHKADKFKAKGYENER
jgi:hypothetical protein